jgi:putative transposase
MPSRLHRYDEPGHTHFWTISCYRRLQFLHDDGMKRVVVDGLRAVQTTLGVCLIGYVIMPEHIHVLVYPHRRSQDTLVPIGSVLQVFKQYIGRHGKERLRQVWRRQGRLWSAPLNRWARGQFGKQEIMNTRGYDHNIFTENELREKLDYCHKNPITRGLTRRADDWRWSSYRFYRCNDRSLLTMDWNGRWPIEWQASRKSLSAAQSSSCPHPRRGEDGPPIPSGKVVRGRMTAQQPE